MLRLNKALGLGFGLKPEARHQVPVRECSTVGRAQLDGISTVNIVI